MGRQIYPYARGAPWDTPLTLRGGSHGAERTMQTRVLGSLSLNTIASAWRGWGTLLARDCPFSALYWMALEHARPKFMHYLASADATDGSAGNMLDYSGLVLANLASGVFAGSCAAVATTPMDVVYVNLAVRNQAGAKPIEERSDL